MGLEGTDRCGQEHERAWKLLLLTTCVFFLIPRAGRGGATLRVVERKNTREKKKKTSVQGGLLSLKRKLGNQR